MIIPRFIKSFSYFQLTKNGGKAILLGDDTWSRLMPKRWLRLHAQYSFHTWDLDTVDNGNNAVQYIQSIQTQYTFQEHNNRHKIRWSYLYEAIFYRNRLLLISFCLISILINFDKNAPLR